MCESCSICFSFLPEQYYFSPSSLTDEPFYLVMLHLYFKLFQACLIYECFEFC